MANQVHQFLITKKEVLRRTSLSNAALYVKIKNKEFCQPVKVGVRGIRFLEAEVDAWIEARVITRDVLIKQRDEGAEE